METTSTEVTLQLEKGPYQKEYNLITDTNNQFATEIMRTFFRTPNLANCVIAVVVSLLFKLRDVTRRSSFELQK